MAKPEIRILLVDQKDSDGGFTQNFDKVIFNIQNCGKEYFDNFQNKVNSSGSHWDILPCGRYISIIEQEQNNKAGMAFFNTENNLEKALVIANHLLKYPDGSEKKKKFMNVFFIMNMDYDKISGDIELTTDTSALS